ncbi:MAG TPA: hypothetical protein VJQ55_07705 [Candidatus Binatia bacterium]|nr:hypothetical protein [Candidatus Binatia bacterium]
MTERSKIAVSPCREHEENLVMFHYGDLDGRDKLTLQEHLCRCASCTNYLDELAALLPLALKIDQPPETFWSDYTRELRRKLDGSTEHRSWVQALRDYFQPRWLPAAATAGVIALAVTFTLGQRTWWSDDPSQQEAAIMEMLPVAENLEFFKTMDVLDNLDLLESMGSQSNAA